MRYYLLGSVFILGILTVNYFNKIDNNILESLRGDGLYRNTANIILAQNDTGSAIEPYDMNDQQNNSSAENIGDSLGSSDGIGDTVGDNNTNNYTDNNTNTNNNENNYSNINNVSNADNSNDNSIITDDGTGSLIAKIVASSTEVINGESTKISWYSINSRSCIVTKDGNSWQTGKYGTADSGTIIADTKFMAICYGSSGRTIDSIIIKVSGAVDNTNNNTTKPDSADNINNTLIDNNSDNKVDISSNIELLTKDLMVGNTDAEVIILQKFLNNHGYKISTYGSGSPGNESKVFGKKTADAVIKLQKDNNIIPPVGFVGPLTRAFINAQLNK